MFNIASAISNMRMRAQIGADSERYEIIDNICDLAYYEIDERIAEILVSAVNEVLSFAEYLDIPDFENEIYIHHTDNDIHITTRSGSLDFSRPEQKMLPHLLKNATTKKSGNRSQVIPIQKKRKKKSRSLVDHMQNLANSSAPIASSSMNRLPGLRKSKDIASGINNFHSTTEEIPEGDVKFRTASSSQDPNKDWVIPEKHADLTLTVSLVNARISMEIDTAIYDIINKYERELWDSF